MRRAVDRKFPDPAGSDRRCLEHPVRIAASFMSPPINLRKYSTYSIHDMKKNDNSFFLFYHVF